jgi:excinuclease ABC subunit C
MPVAKTPLTSGLGPRPGDAMPIAHARAVRAEFRARCPERPGVYVMTAPDGTVVYVGKSVSLRDRLSTYLRAADVADKAWRIAHAAEQVRWEVWPDEFGGMLREIELIQALGPRYNVQFNPARKRRGYVSLTLGPEPRLVATANPPTPDAAQAMIGPLPSRRRLLAACEILNDHFKLATCAMPDKAGPRPACFRHLVRDCLAPCIGACAPSAYAAQIERAQDFLLGKDLSVVRDAFATMTAAAEALEFERAALLRDRWQLLKWTARRMRDLRRTRRGYDYVYVMPASDGGPTETWYLLRGGLCVAMVPGPVTADERRAVAHLIASTYVHPRGRRPWPDALAGENLALVMRWFKERPEEKTRLLHPDAAIARASAAAAPVALRSGAASL